MASVNGTTTFSETYGNLQLPTAATNTWVLDVSPGDLDNPETKLTLRFISLEPAPEYEALSYTWGECTQCRSVWVNTKH